MVCLSYSERGRVISQRPHQIQNQASTKELWILVVGLFTFLSAASPGLPQYETLQTDWKAWEGRFGVRNEMEDNEAVSSGASSSGQSQINCH